MEFVDDFSVYRELYHFEGSTQTLMINEITQKVCLRKVLSVYNIDVYRYLMEHTDKHIPRIYALEEKNGTLTVIEEYIEGQTLESLMKKKSLNIQQVLQLMENLCDGMSFLHSAEPPIIHRDLKPSNLMITDDGVLKIIDFDAARCYQESEKRDTTLIGTEGFAAPEQYGFRQTDSRTDIYAAGMLMREMLECTDDQSENPGNENKRIMASARKIVSKATEMDPGNRYDNAAAMKKAVHKTRIHGGRFRLLPVPGFRTGVTWKKIVAVIIYCLIIGGNIMMTEKQETSLKIMVMDHIYLALASFICVDIVTDWTGIFCNLPFNHDDKRWKRILSRLVSCFAICFLLLALLVLAEGSVSFG